MPAKIPQDIRERQLQELAEADGYSFIGWSEGFANNTSVAVFKCFVHGEWCATINSFVSMMTRCRECSHDARLLSERERLVQISAISEPYGYSFKSWIGKYRGARGKMVMSCPTHGQWSVTVGRYVTKGTKCPSCSTFGYDITSPGVLYALRSTDGTKVKIGITSDTTVRYSALRRETPFRFGVIREICSADGSIPPMLERLFHNQFPSAGLSGFDGATEWRLWHDDVNIWFDLLGG